MCAEDLQEQHPGDHGIEAPVAPKRMSDVMDDESEHLTNKPPSLYMRRSFKCGGRMPAGRTQSMPYGNVFDFQKLTFTVKDRKNKVDKDIIHNVSGRVHYGDMLAMMGPSGAGKSSLINALTLGAFGGTTTGSVTLNGLPMTDSLFKEHCFLVEQYDKLWPHLTCKETMMYAAQLYASAENREDTEKVVDDIIGKMGLESCKDTRSLSMSGGQKRRLSVAIALLKQPTVIFLDEPTSGLDAASASNVMAEIASIAKQENIIILCTIHQPSFKVYEMFSQVMILSKGRVAYVGDTNKALDYFEGIGYPMEKSENPADFMLDCVNADFTSVDDVVKILDAWDEKAASDEKAPVQSDGIVPEESGAGMAGTASILFRRQALIIKRDPVLYLGRTVAFILANLFFSFVYFDARTGSQAEVLNKCWLFCWYVGPPGMMGVVAVYGLNEEFKAIKSEMKNGMMKVSCYAIVKTLLVIPIMFVFAICAMSLSGYAIHQYPVESYGMVILTWAITMYAFECMAEANSVLFSNAIFGMLNFIGLWFASFLFSGLLINETSMIWPFRAIYYVMPLGYSFQNMVYLTFKDFDWDKCNRLEDPHQPVCLWTDDGEEILDETGNVYPLFGSDTNVAKNLGIMLAISAFWKCIYLFFLFRRSREATTIKQV